MNSNTRKSIHNIKIDFRLQIFSINQPISVVEKGSILTKLFDSHMGYGEIILENLNCMVVKEIIRLLNHNKPSCTVLKYFIIIARKRN
jgi:hypothetical protein